MNSRYQYGLARYVQQESHLKDLIVKCDRYLEKARLEGDKESIDFYSKAKQIYIYRLKGVKKNG